MINLYFFFVKVSKELFRSYIGHNSETPSCGDGIEHDSEGDWGGEGSNEPQHREMAGNVAPDLEVLIVKAASHTLYREEVVYTRLSTEPLRVHEIHPCGNAGRQCWFLRRLRRRGFVGVGASRLRRPRFLLIGFDRTHRLS
ncbi:unnamed protein product [Camellia sinensis]